MEISTIEKTTTIKTSPTKITSRVIGKRYVNNEILILTLERNNLVFKAGQYVVLSFPNEKEAREYSIFSGENDSYIEILLKTVPAGSFSKRLGALQAGDELQIEGPFGFFVMREDEIYSKKHVFIATGTGLSPFKSYLKSYPNIDYKLLHGIAKLNEQIDANKFKKESIQYCVSREHSSYFNGRVTDFLKLSKVESSSIFHLCGNSEMINDVSDILENQGVDPENIRTEAFF